MHVNNNQYAEVGHLQMCMAMRYSIHTLHQVSGGDDPALRPRLVDREKFFREPVGHRCTQLGVTIDTRLMHVEMPNSKRVQILGMLTVTWGHHRASFTIMEAAILLRTLIDAASTCPWGIFLFISLQQTLHQILMMNHQQLMQSEQYRELVASLNNRTTTVLPARIHWFNQKMGRALWVSKEKTFFNAELRTELDYLTSTFRESAKCSWSAPIALLIQREPTYVTSGDACLTDAGGFSLPLQFWWILEWPVEIQERTLRYLGKGGMSLISVTLLEYATVVLGLAASIVSWEGLREPKPAHPLLLLFTDNTTAESWTKRIAGLKSLPARALA